MDPRSPVADRVCRLKPPERETIAGAPVKGLFLYYYSGKLEMITITLDPKHFPEVVAALTEKYGTGSLETETLKNLTGATFENKMYSWRRNKATLEAQTYGRNLETSSVIYRTDFSLQEYTRRSGAAVKEKATPCWHRSRLARGPDVDEVAVLRGQLVEPRLRRRLGRRRSSARWMAANARRTSGAMRLASPQT